jgi:hypothetical protein
MSKLRNNLEARIMSWVVRNIVVKGRKEAINEGLNAAKYADVRDIEDLGNDLVLYRVDLGDQYCNDDFSDVPFVDREDVKFLALADNDEEYGDKVFFKQFDSTEIQVGDAFDPDFVSTFMEELEGEEVPFMDKPFEFDMESYSDGEWYHVENAMTFGGLWEDDSAFVE